MAASHKKRLKAEGQSRGLQLLQEVLRPQPKLEEDTLAL